MSTRPSEHGPRRQISLVKALASQLILLHHFALYGPMADTVVPRLGAAGQWLVDYGRMAVHAFLVVGGYLAARSLLAGPADSLPGRIGRRYLRLVPPYAVALLLAVLAAALARTLVEHPTTPTAPTWLQLAAHVLLLHDIFGHEALSAGVWYVAIDFQLFALFALIAATGGRYALAVCFALTLLSVFWLNRVAALDVWALYFFGSYGLGILAWASAYRPRRWPWLAALALLVAAGLLVDWRERLLVAGVVALLMGATDGRLAMPLLPGRLVDFLARISYAVFLVHYPVLLAVGAVVGTLWAGQPVAGALGLAVAWGLTLLLADALHRRVEQPALRIRS